MVGDMQTTRPPTGGLVALWTPTLLLLGQCSGFSSHTWQCNQVMWDSGQGMPTFLYLQTLDDQVWGRYDSSMKRVLPQVSWIKKAEEDDPSFWDWNQERASSAEVKLRGDLMLLKKHINQSEGILVWQRRCGCELYKDGHRRGIDRYGYNGRDFLTLDFETLTWTATYEAAEAIKKEWEANLAYSQASKANLEECCIPWLQKFLEYGKDILLRKENPMVKVSRKLSEDGLETLTCRVHGFYPKEINATWRKDGAFWEQETLSGGVIPNSDGTYHTWISIKIDCKERDRYWCHVKHASLVEPLQMSWQKSNTGRYLVGVTFGLVAAVLMLIGIVFYLKKQKDIFKARSRSDSQRHGPDALTTQSMRKTYPSYPEDVCI